MPDFKQALLATILAGLAGCATGEKMARLQPGMSKAAAEKAMGRPDRFKTEGADEVYVYSNRMMSGWSWDKADYVLRFSNGALVAYGPENIVHRQYVPPPPTQSAYVPPPPGNYDVNPGSIAMPPSPPLPPPPAEFSKSPSMHDATPDPQLPTQQQMSQTGWATGRTKTATDGAIWREYKSRDGNPYWVRVWP